MDNYRVLIVADDPLARAGLAALLAGQAGCTVVGQVAASDDVLASLEVYRPDVIAWDPGWDPALSSDHLPDFGDGGLPVVALLSDTSQAADIWTAGARGLLRRDTTPAALLAAIAAAMHGLAVIDPALASALPLARPGSPSETLTPRELEVLRLLAEGLPNKAIARQLDISEHTVKFHLNAILGKLGAQSRTEAVVQAIRLGLVAV
jgi:two-component system nitrate/nitrite response regulator NarL